MCRKFSFSASVFVVILVISMACAVGASAVGLHQQRALRLAHNSQAPPLIAPPDVCPPEEDLTAGPEEQEQAMLCMIDYARLASGLPAVTPIESLTGSAELKARDILACEEFSHFACGRPFGYWIKASGYTSVPCWRIGEIIAYGRGRYGTPRSIFIAWMQSPTHRHVILNHFNQVGVSVKLGNLGYYGRVRVWTGHFGTQECE